MSICPEGWAGACKLEIAHLVLATLRGLLIDRLASPSPAEAAPRGELVRLTGNHYAPFVDGHAAAVDTETRFLRRHLGAGQALCSA